MAAPSATSFRRGARVESGGPGGRVESGGPGGRGGPGGLGGALRGTRPCGSRSQLLVSTGIPSLDSALGGGLALGSLLLIEEDAFGSFAHHILRCFLAQGIASGHDLYVASADTHPDDIIQELPAPVLDEPPAGRGGPCGRASDAEGMEIAWRYQNMPKVETAPAAGATLGQSFDLSRTMGAELRAGARVHTFHLPAHPPLARTATPHGVDAVPGYSALLRSLAHVTQDPAYDLSPPQPPTPAPTPPAAPPPRRVLRASLPSLGGAAWGDDSTSGPPPLAGPPRSNAALPRLLLALRSLLRSSLCVAVATVPAHLGQDDAWLRRVERASDSVLRLESFAGSPRGDVHPLYREHHGLLHVVRAPRLNSLTTALVDSHDLAFRVRRRRFLVEKLHLPPDLSDTASRSGPNASACGGGATTTSSLDF
ncbi:LOW QUALITY PROTEIN: elongator complex protein 4 [Lampetra fluviatilis]